MQRRLKRLQIYPKNNEFTTFLLRIIAIINSFQHFFKKKSGLKVTETSRKPSGHLIISQSRIQIKSCPR